MKPVNKGASITGLTDYKQAKPDLLSRLGEFCSYCESPGLPTQLHVEHIYPEADTAHPGRVNSWRNLLLSCATCNSYKRHHLGDGRQAHLLKRYLWPHLDNTYNAFDYHSDGRVTVNTHLSPTIAALANQVVEMVGLLKSPAATASYEHTAIAYDGISRRAEAWGIASTALAAYAENPSANQLRSICNTCKKTGHFSIWMKVFHTRPVVRQALIDECKAAQECFDAGTLPLARGRL